MESHSSNSSLPPIPAKRYFTIGEVSELCGVKPHVLRYWEQEFTQLKPVKRRGNRRYYQRQDVIVIRQIRSLAEASCVAAAGTRADAGSDHLPDSGTDSATLAAGSLPQRLRVEQRRRSPPLSSRRQRIVLLHRSPRRTRTQRRPRCKVTSWGATALRPVTAQTAWAVARLSMAVCPSGRRAARSEYAPM